MELLNINDLRTVLAEEIIKLRNKETTPAAVNAITNATGKILSTVKLEIEYAKLLNKAPMIPFIKVSDEIPDSQKQNQIGESGVESIST
jgi:hypothetical protein